MHRLSVVAAATLLCSTSLLAAQTPPLYSPDRDPRPVPNAIITITPYVGLRSPLVSERTATVLLPGVIPLAVDLQGERRGGGIGGAEAELRFGAVGLVASVAASNPDKFLVTTQTGSGIITQTRVDGPSVYFARAGISYRFPEPRDEDGLRKYRPAAFISIGPAIVREDYGDGLFALGGDDDTVDNWALAISLKGVQTLGTDRLAVHFGLDDFVTFWDPKDAEQRRMDRFLDLQPGTVLGADFDYDETHILLVHIGLSLRL